MMVTRFGAAFSKEQLSREGSPWTAARASASAALAAATFETRGVFRVTLGRTMLASRPVLPLPRLDVVRLAALVRVDVVPVL